MYSILIFAGTTEGRELAEYLSRQEIRTEVCVATEYGGQLLGEDAYRTVHAGRMTADAMCAQMEELAEQADGGVLVVDATHPYAAEVSANIRTACKVSGAEYIRLIRESSPADGGELVAVDSVQEAVEFLKGTEGNILVTTGSKELAKFTELPGFTERVFARVLSTPEVAAACAQLGFTGKHLICMQGPFREDLNAAMLRQFDAKWMVTKESGKTGGFEEKIRAAQSAGARVVLVGRPPEEEGLTPMQVRAYLMKKLQVKPKRQISIVGIGMGAKDGMTVEAKKACMEAELLVGAKRMLEGFDSLSKAQFVSYQPHKIRAYVEEHPEFERIVLLQSGDVGFYSGAKNLYEVFADEELTVYPGISSAVYLCAKLQIPWEDVKLVSLHGRYANIIAAVKRHKKVFALVGKGESLCQLMEKLVYYGMEDVRVTVGENLSYLGEKIRRGTAGEFAQEMFRDLCVALIENDKAHPMVTHGIEDEAFLRDAVPMTKSEVRSISLSKLRLCADSIVYDVGAGTGSVSIEAALQAADGRVYAIEKKPEAAALILANQQKFAVDNLTVITGLAPASLEQLPVPTHVFIGGSSGNLKEILEAALQKNPSVRIVINCIALETVAEALECLKALPVADTDIVTVSAARAKEVGRYHMMMGQNPVYIISCSGSSPAAEGGEDRMSLGTADILQRQS